ncbi:F0F1 ATP synthase subunit gamma [Pectobacteriaceae bacterium C52]|nr:F0F1 ATP synthase subunit gamma [Pectobacteriaceae bacterium C52]
MSNTTISLHHKIGTATDLESVVRTMKAMAASSISQYENAVRSLDDYNRTIQLGLLACCQQQHPAVTGQLKRESEGAIGAVIFGSDQGLVGQFNDLLVEFAVETLGKLPGRKIVWAVGERIKARLANSELSVGANFQLPNSIGAITSLVGHVLLEMESWRTRGEIGPVYLFYNRSISGAISEPICQRLLPLDDEWYREMASRHWPSHNLPEVMPDIARTMFAFVREYFFVSLFRACAESLASENICRLTAMQRAEKNIGEILETLSSDFHRLRQSAIDEELFDVVSGFGAYDR